MRFDPPLIPAILLRRYKRFLADVQMESGEEITVHTPNTGSMLGCSDASSRIWLRDSNNTTSRKYRYSWVMTENRDGVLIGVDTLLPNHLVVEGIENGNIKELQGYASIRREVSYGRESSRIDLLLQDDARADCYIEVKNVTASTEPGIAKFPDAVTTRGSKHLRELIEVVKQGDRAVIFFVVQRADAQSFRPAEEIDPQYSAILREAVQAGVEALSYRVELSSAEAVIGDAMPVVL